MVDYLAFTYSLSAVLIAGVAAFAIYIGYRKRRDIATTENFITARKQVSTGFIAWSFYAGAVGAWVIASPASYAAYAGMLGLVFYSLASGLPFIMIAFAGDKIRNQVPHVRSLTDYMGWRFGFASKTLVIIIVLFNMSIALLAEYTTIGSIFTAFVGSVPYPMIIVVGLVTAIYTAYGGLLVSIYTDRIQGVFSLVFFGMLAIYMAAAFRPASLPTPMPCSPDDPNGLCISGTPDCGAFSAAGLPCPISGYSSIFVMPASLFAATIFSEAMWQRAWAAKDAHTLHRGAIIGASAVVIVVFFAGLCGLLAAWAGLVTFETNPNLYLFQVLGGGTQTVSMVSNWIGAVCVVCATVMNLGAVDSIQNGMAGAITSYITPFYEKWTLSMTRILVLVLNVTLMIVAIALNGCFTTQDGVNQCGNPYFLKVSVLQLFLIANMLACCVALPVLAGLADRLHRVYGAVSFLFSAIFPVFCVSWYGVDYYNDSFPPRGVFPSEEEPVTYSDFSGKTYTPGDFNDAMYYTWIGNGYAWDFFLVPMCVSIGSVILCCAINAGINRFWTGKMKRIELPFLTAPATHPDMYAADVVAGHRHVSFGSREFSFNAKAAAAAAAAGDGGSSEDLDGEDKKRNSGEEEPAPAKVEA